MPRSAKQRCDSIISAAATECFAILEHEAKAVLATSNRYSAFAAAMGTSCFYGRDGHSVFDEDLTKRAARVIELADELTDCFGSPGFHFKR